MIDWSRQTTGELLAAYAAIMRELRTRRAIRSTNNPVADLAEGLAELAFGLELAGGSTKSYDGICSAGKRWQVKGRRLAAGRHGASPATGSARCSVSIRPRKTGSLALRFAPGQTARAFRLLRRFWAPWRVDSGAPSCTQCDGGVRVG